MTLCVSFFSPPPRGRNPIFVLSRLVLTGSWFCPAGSVLRDAVLFVLIIDLVLVLVLFLPLFLSLPLYSGPCSCSRPCSFPCPVLYIVLVLVLVPVLALSLAPSRARMNPERPKETKRDLQRPTAEEKASVLHGPLVRLTPLEGKLRKKINRPPRMMWP